MMTEMTETPLTEQVGTSELATAEGGTAATRAPGAAPPLEQVARPKKKGKKRNLKLP
jgi:hypothetical protein